MAGLFWVAEAVLLGCLLVQRLGMPGRGWARYCLVFGAGSALGIGLASSLFFVFRGLPGIAISLEAGGIVWSGYENFRRRHHEGRDANTGWPAMARLVAAGLLVALAVAGAAAVMAFESNPHGWWDAWAIWNLRARFLASDPALASRAWSPMLGPASHTGLGGVHPEYPLLLSGFVGRCWRLSHSFSPAVPAATAFVFFLALVAMAAGGVAALRGTVLGLLAGLSLAAAPSLLHQASVYCADVPLACYLLGAVIMGMLDRPVVAGAFAGLAAWTKDEGWFFLALFMAATVVFKRRGALAAAAGAAPAALLALFFKMVLARGNPSLLSASLPGLGRRLVEAGRYATTLEAFGHQAVAMGVGWYHPVLPLIALAASLKLTREHRREAIYCGAIAGSLLAVYFWTFIVTANDLSWQLTTSLDRLLVQVWPMMLVAGFLCLGAADPPRAAAPAPGPRKERRRSGR